MIYSAIVGGIDSPRQDGVKCFTDSLNFDNPRMAAKMYKILPFYFMNTKWSVWVDGNIELKVSEEWLIESTKPKEIGVFEHGERNPAYDRDCIYEEGEFCIKKDKGNPKKIREQLKVYQQMGYPRNNGLRYCGVIVRKHTPQMQRLCERWWAHICRYSSRDQISFPVVFGDAVKVLPRVTMGNNEYFKRWKHGNNIRRNT